MLKLAKNFAEGKLLKESYNSLVQMFELLRMKTQICFTLESLYRITESDEEKENINKKVIAINTFGANSYNTYSMNRVPIKHEFPADGDDIPKLVYITDRYMAIMHVLALLKPSEVDIAKKIIKLAAKVEAEFFAESQECGDQTLIDHVTNVIGAAEYLAASTLKDFDGTKLMIEAINYGYKEKQIYLDILKRYYDEEDEKNAVKFYNKYYATKFNTKKCKSINTIQQLLFDNLMVNRN